MRCTLLLLIALALVAAARGEEGAPASIYETGAGFEPAGALDECVLAALQAHGIAPARPCSDAVFIRRIFVDALGVLPEAAEVERFLRDARPDRRARLIDEVLARDELVDLLTMRWCDVLRVKSEFPIRLWPNGVQAYHRWIRDAVRENRPIDQVARELLTASGSNFRVPAVNFHRAVQSQDAQGRAAAVALTFMGVRLERWDPERRAGMEAFFSRVVAKPTAEWKEEIVLSDPAPGDAVRAVFPDGVAVEIPWGTDPRAVFADWLLAPGSEWFARSVANRVWSWCFGRGVVHEVDDLRPDNPPANPELLACLERILVDSGHDVRALLRAILGSRTYQASSIPQSEDPLAPALFASYPVRRLDAEVLVDALARIDGQGVDYVSIVPEPFTIIPGLARSVMLEDGTITSPTLETFGRPARDTGLGSERSDEMTEAQRLYLLNSSEVQRRIEQSPWLRELMRDAIRQRRGITRPIYMGLLSRPPTPAEATIVRRHLAAARDAQGKRQAVVDLVWALVNSAEFLYRH